MNTKKLAADKAVSYVKDGMTVGLGTGSTAYWAIEGIGQRIKDEGLNLKAIATSIRSEEQARACGIPIVSFAEINEIDLTIDGADEADEHLELIKGGGGALLREKIVASNSKRVIIIVDETKLVKRLGAFRVPVEVIRFGWEKNFKNLQQTGCAPLLRMSEDRPYLTDNNNYIIDCDFGLIEQPAELHNRINAIPGIVENGLFINIASMVIAGYSNGEIKILER